MRGKVTGMALIGFGPGSSPTWSERLEWGSVHCDKTVFALA